MRRIVARTLAVAVGAVASMLIAVPATAGVPNGGGQNDGQPACMPTGEIANIYHIFYPNDGTVSNFMSIPVGKVIDNGPNSNAVTQLLPAGTTSVTGISFLWTSSTDPTNTAVFTAPAVQMLPSCSAYATAAFTASCDRVVDVTLTNRSTAPLTFYVNGTPRIVDGSGSLDVPGVAPDSSDDVVVAVDDRYWLKGLLLDSYHWSACSSATPTPTTANLAQTGSSMSGLIGAGTGLLVFGAGLVAVSLLRRRRGASLGRS